MTPSGEPEAWEAPQGAGVPEGALCRGWPTGTGALETVHPLGHRWALSWRQPALSQAQRVPGLSSPPRRLACGPYLTAPLQHPFMGQ